MKPLISTLAVALSLTAFAPDAQAEEVCMTAGEMKAALIDWYGEQPIDAPNENREQLWVSKATGTWTMVRMLADGNACVIAQGDDWMSGLGQTELVAQLTD